MRYFTGIFVLFLLMSSAAHGQFRANTAGQQYRAQAGLRTSASAILRGSNVSPYLALTDINGQGLDQSRNYFTVVRPQIERQQQQQRQQLQIQQIQQNMANLRSAGARRSQQGMRITGHPTRFNHYLQYYPLLNR